MRFFFDLDDATDEVGTDLPDKETARREALRLVLAVAGDSPLAVGSMTVAIRDAWSNPIYRASLHLDEQWLEPASVESVVRKQR